jgi:hypothetical protein
MLRVVAVRVAPSFSFVDGGFTSDLALLDLERDAPAIPARLGSLAPGHKLTGTALLAVGFGIDPDAESADAALSGRTGVKRSGIVYLEEIGISTLRVTDGPSQPCLGDSGGPLFDGEVVVGIASSGDPACRVYGLYQRADRAQDGFLAAYFPGDGAARPQTQTASGGCAVTPSGTRSQAPGVETLVACAWLVAAFLRRTRKSRAVERSE